MKRLVAKLNLSVSITAIGSAIALASLLPLSAAAQTNAKADADIEVVTVTGTNIAGAQPVGSHVNAVGAEDIQALAPANVSDMVNSLPMISQANTLTQGANTYSYYSPNIHHLTASNGNSTLVVIDGMRMPGGGEQGLGADPNILPSLAVQRVEVLADGASSIYGSDALAGVVNFITRKNFEGVQIAGQVAFAKANRVQNLDVLWGTKWEDGGVYAAATYSSGNNIPLRERPYLALGDYTPLGGRNQQSYSCDPATIRVGASTTAYYRDYTATTTIPGSAASGQAASPCNLQLALDPDLVPATTRVNAMIHVNQNFWGGRLSVSDDIVINNLRTKANGGAGIITATVFGTGAQANPFYRAPAGAPTATSETISWVDLIAPRRPQSFTGSDVLYNKLRAEFNVTDTWRITMDWVAGMNITNDSTINQFCTACAYLALNGTGLTGGSTTTTDVGGQNIIALNLPLTTANALDVWNPAATNRTNPLVLQKLYANQSEQNVFNAISQLRLETDAALFELPAGTLRGAIGGEYYNQHVTKDQAGPVATGPGAINSFFVHNMYQRNALSAFAELIIPAISPEMNVPMVQSLSFDLSIRDDEFSDVGHTGNPKYAVDWEVTDGLKIRSNYSTSFVAAPLISLGDPNFGYANTSNSGNAGPVSASVAGQTNNLPVAQYPLAATVPGAVCTGTTISATTGCPYVTLGQINGANGDQGISQTLGGAALGAKPTTGINWTLGVDFVPDFIPGLAVSATWWNTTIKGANKSTNAFSNPSLASRAVFCTPANGHPTGCTAAEIADFAKLAQGAYLGPLPQGPVWYMNPGYQANSQYIRGVGFDIDTNYAYDSGDAGVFKVGNSLALITKWDLGIDPHTYSSILGQGNNGNTISAVAYTDRISAGWVKDAWVVDFWVNYTPGYHNTGAQAANIVTSNPLTGFADTHSGDIVKSNTTFDMNVAYSFADGMFGGDQIFVHGKNILDTRPSFQSANAGGIGAVSGSFGYNALISSPLGRQIAIGFRAKF